jgi:hypothetical protein
MILEIFLKDLFYFDYNNLIGQKPHFLYFLLLGIFTNSKEPRIFFYATFYGRWRPRELRTNLELEEGQDRPMARPNTLVAPW